jgi:hypothetical protein
MLVNLDLATLRTEAGRFAEIESEYSSEKLYTITNGKAIGTYLEHKFQAFLSAKYTYEVGNSARGIDFPGLGVDMKVTKITQPQSSCPFKSARQKIYGLGYSLLVFVYDKEDDLDTQTGNMNILHTIFVDKSRTADYQTTTGLCKILENDGNIDDVLAFFEERMLPVEEIAANELAEEVLNNPPHIGYLTISNALQWRLQYRRAIEKAGEINGLFKVW